MGTTRETITLTDKQDQWIKAQIAAGEYTNDSEYIRDLVRRDQEENTKFLALKQATQEGVVVIFEVISSQQSAIIRYYSGV